MAREVKDLKIGIIGSGFAGLCMAIKLKESGYSSFTIFERAEKLGGTWRDNTYPGCACDVQSHLYSFSFFPKNDWSRTFSGYHEIWEYLKDCADHHDLMRFIKFNSSINKAVWNESNTSWQVQSSDGEKHEFDFLVAATGGLSEPSFPEIPGIQDFEGSIFHSSRWDHELELKGKRVAVIGTGASAIQFVPRVAEKASRLMLFQRTPPWVMPKPDRPFSKIELWAFEHIPILRWVYREVLYWLFEMRVIAFVYKPALMKLMQKRGEWYIKRTVKDPETQKKLIPKFILGCKRVLMSNDYYQTFNRKNVELITEQIDHFEKDAIVTREGLKYDVDSVILGTGFKATEYLFHIDIIGKNEKRLKEVWQKGPQAYKGTVVSGFPNFFIFTGPNTGLGHTSVIHIMESQTAYIIDALEQLRNSDLKAFDIRKEVQDEFNRNIMKKMDKTVWQTGGCKSWYQDDTGHNPTLWPGTTWYFRRMTRHFDKQNYIFT